MISLALDMLFIVYSLNLFCASFMIHIRLSCRFGKENMAESLLRTSVIMILLFITALLFSLCHFSDAFGEWALFVGSSAAFLITIIHTGEVLRGYPIINWLVGRCRRELSRADSVGLRTELLMASDLLAHRLTDYFEKEKPFLSPELCIHQVAMFLMTNKTTLSRVIHSKMNANFREYVNRYRIREAMHLFVKNMHLDMEELAKLSGFRNNASFTNAFKVNTGMTPGAWCKEQKEKKNEIWKKEILDGLEEGSFFEEKESQAEATADGTVC
ncbi:MAG: AraC family transcriptional regulator, partial [Alistipes sp.]|nr:AraC family transcriptional regulator [Candidatus Minthomonas equi]